MLTKEQREQAKKTVLFGPTHPYFQPCCNQALATAEQLQPVWLKEGEEAALKRVGEKLELELITGFRKTDFKKIIESLKRGKQPEEAK